MRFFVLLLVLLIVLTAIYYISIILLIISKLFGKSLNSIKVAIPFYGWFKIFKNN